MPRGFITSVARPVSRSTLCDANARRSSEVFAGLFREMVARAGRGLRRSVSEATYLIDATGVRLSGAGCDWARFSHQACGAKVHVVYDADAERPIYAAVTPANVNDITAAKAMPIAAGATYVFDLGYYDFGWWAALDKAGCRIVTRFKSHTKLTVTSQQAVSGDGIVLFDRIGLLPARMAASRRNRFGDPVREITVRTQTGKVLRLLTNDLDAPAQEIADLYKRRWAIELFFRWVKQTLRIPAFPWQQRERRAHPDRRGAHRLSIVAHGAGRPETRPKPTGIRTPGARQSYASPKNRQPHKAATS
ncbi:hypothetical protein AGR6A_Lc90499 [Agrobacterium sp. NCPPB 925]|nr:hypothetical protein AGR6A_Lc50105 [Agrobacterium sp. NCPPB 925]CUX67102.1 hypothetical protein AGR6A_Lc80036 [Agrobacterium sp. NCPPB 925]CUX67232.1 hypothetical protein AGR6A_Lc80060 [Agrobacterium sp. NCPPB 925]CUX69039.1 hypothetical protein AGR6A_Lc90330 [Agrobacterium sp. NCPPB 925]CUX69555.1 hypothetical protein AGR6A_Lc90499 [Agrobacterium sp. NCPPB 925]